MKRKIAQAIIGLTLSTVLMSAAPMCAMAEDASATASTAEAVTASEYADAFKIPEGAALLSQTDYAPGTISAGTWSNDYLNMKYLPAEGIKIDEEQNKTLNKFYERDGEGKNVAISELVARDETNGYMQVMVEVNPNHEREEDILGRFAETENLDLVSKTKDMEIGGRTFKTCSGILQKERYFLAVSSENDVIVAMKVKYKTSKVRDKVLNGFAPIHQEEAKPEQVQVASGESATQPAQAVSASQLNMPGEFEDAVEINGAVLESGEQ